MARRFATRIGGIRANRFAEKNLFSQRASDSGESPQSFDSQFLPPPPPEARFAKEEVEFGNPETIRENQAIRANLRIGLRESGHLSHFLISSELGHRGCLGTFGFMRTSCRGRIYSLKKVCVCVVYLLAPSRKSFCKCLTLRALLTTLRPCKKQCRPLGSDGFKQILTGFYLLIPVKVRSKPSETHNFNGIETDCLIHAIWLNP